MSLDVTINTDEIKDFIKVLEVMPEMTAKESMVAMRKVVLEVERQAIRVQVRKKVHNYGTLKDAWTTKVTKGTRGIKGIVMSPLPYAIVMEKGRKAGATAPPTDAIRLWITRKKGLRGREADSAAFLIARSIGEKGIKGRHMLEEGYEAAEPTVMKLFRQVPRRVVNKIAKK